jgi:hypothetical protein
VNALYKALENLDAIALGDMDHNSFYVSGKEKDYETCGF